MEKKRYSLPIYEDGVKTEYTVDFEEGDEKWHTLMAIHSEIPMLINVKMKKHGQE